MAKANVYLDLLSTKSIIINEFMIHDTKPHIINFSKVLSSPKLFDNISLLIEHQIHMKSQSKALVFDKICATSMSAIPYATNIATSFEKPFCYIQNTNNDTQIKNNIKNIQIEGGLNIDDKILLIETVCNNDYYIENIIERITKYGGIVVGIIIILDICEGEYIKLLHNKLNIINVLNLYDICNHLENNNLIDLFYAEKIKFYCEKTMKASIRKLLEENTCDSTSPIPIPSNDIVATASPSPSPSDNINEKK